MQFPHLNMWKLHVYFISISIFIIIVIIIIVSEALFRLCCGTNNSTHFGVCPTFRSRTTAFIIFCFFSLWILIFAGARKTQEDTL